MNTAVYLFGKLGGNYTQYPDDYTRDVFSIFEENIKSPVQLMICRNDNLVYYGYLRQLSEQGNYIGIGFAFNSVMCTDISLLCKLCEESVTNMVVMGDILEFTDNGNIVSKIDKLYKIAAEFERLSEILSAQIVSLQLPFKKLPPVNYAVTDEVKVFSLETDKDIVNEALNEYNRIYIYSNSTSETLKGYSAMLRTKNNEIKALKAENAKIIKAKERTTLVMILAILTIIVLIVLFATSIIKNKTIEQLREDKTSLNQQKENLQGQVRQLEKDLTNTTSYVHRLQQDSTNLEKKNTKIESELTIANKKNIEYRRTIDKQNAQIQEKDKTISNLQSQLQTQSSSNSASKYQSSSNSSSDSPFTISSINTNIISKGKIQVTMTYLAQKSCRKTLYIDLYGPPNYKYYDSAVEEVAIFESKYSNTYTFSHTLGTGKKLPAGNYKVEIMDTENYLELKSYQFRLFN